LGVHDRFACEDEELRLRREFDFPGADTGSLSCC
jgi:hypothetical protein